MAAHDVDTISKWVAREFSVPSSNSEKLSSTPTQSATTKILTPEKAFEDFNIWRRDQYKSWLVDFEKLKKSKFDLSDDRIEWIPECLKALIKYAEGPTQIRGNRTLLQAAQNEIYMDRGTLAESQKRNHILYGLHKRDFKATWPFHRLSLWIMEIDYIIAFLDKSADTKEVPDKLAKMAVDLANGANMGEDWESYPDDTKKTWRKKDLQSKTTFMQWLKEEVDRIKRCACDPWENPKSSCV